MKFNHFLSILKHQHPEIYDSIKISVSSQSDYQQYRGMDGRMRAELNYNSPAKYDYKIMFPNVGSLYYDMCFYIDYVWGGTINVISTVIYNYHSVVTHKFEFTV